MLLLAHPEGKLKWREFREFTQVEAIRAESRMADSGGTILLDETSASFKAS